MTILITGVAGFIGNDFCIQLAKKIRIIKLLVLILLIIIAPQKLKIKE